MSQNLPKRSLGDFLSLRHPNHFVLAGANNRNVIITYRFLAAPVQANRDFFQYLNCKYCPYNIRASYQGASSGFRSRRNPCGGNQISKSEQNSHSDRIAFHADNKTCLVQYEQQRHRTGTSRPIEHRAKAVGRDGLVNLHPSQWIPVLAPSYSLPLRSDHLFTLSFTLHTCSHFTKVWHRTYPICNDPLSRSARSSFAPLRKSR